MPDRPGAARKRTGGGRGRGSARKGDPCRQRGDVQTGPLRTTGALTSQRVWPAPLPAGRRPRQRMSSVRNRFLRQRLVLLRACAVCMVCAGCGCTTASPDGRGYRVTVRRMRFYPAGCLQVATGQTGRVRGDGWGARAVFVCAMPSWPCWRAGDGVCLVCTGCLACFFSFKEKTRGGSTQCRLAQRERNPRVFLRNGRPYGLKHKAFQTKNTPCAALPGRPGRRVCNGGGPASGPGTSALTGLLQKRRDVMGVRLSDEVFAFHVDKDFFQ